MKAAARVQAAIDLAAAIESAALDAGPSAEDVTRRFFRERRYAGAKDRRAVITLAYDMVRHRAGDLWRLETGAASPSFRMRAALRLADTGEDWQSLFSGDDPHGPGPLSTAEAESVAAALARDLSSAPESARLGFPVFLTDDFHSRFEDRLEAELAGLHDRAPLDLRVNTLKESIKKAAQGLETEGIFSLPTPLSPIGLRATVGAPVKTAKAFQSGRVEIQDEGAQLAALLCGAKAGDQVIDFCAGAGGKTLALAAMMHNRGQIYALDPDARRIRDLRRRAKRADARNIQPIVLDQAGRGHLKTLRGTGDIVLVDVPCCGTGTWRRSPELPWRLSPERLDDFLRLQARILAEAGDLVRPGGRLVYVTCSVLIRENEAIVEAFLSARADWAIVPYTGIWPTFSDGPPPPTLARDERFLQLTPATHGTDGFFVAVLRAPD